MEVRDFAEKFTATFDKIRHVNKDVWLFLFIVLPFFGLILFARLSEGSSKASKSDCYNQASQNLAAREGNHSVSKADIERYTSEITGSCR